jgi:putative transposase
MNKLTTSTAIPTRELKLEALSNISASFELFCLASGMEALGEMMDHDAQAICGPRHARGHERQAHRWGKTKGKIGFHGGKVEIERPRLRGFDGKEQPVPSWEAAVAEDWLGKWAMNQMLINVATVSLPDRFGCLRETFRRRRGLVCRNRPPPAAS